MKYQLNSGQRQLIEVNIRHGCRHCWAPWTVGEFPKEQPHNGKDEASESRTEQVKYEFEASVSKARPRITQRIHIGKVAVNGNSVEVSTITRDQRFRR